MIRHCSSAPCDRQQPVLLLYAFAPFSLVTGSLGQVARWLRLMARSGGAAATEPRQEMWTIRRSVAMKAENVTFKGQRYGRIGHDLCNPCRLDISRGVIQLYYSRNLGCSAPLSGQVELTRLISFFSTNVDSAVIPPPCCVPPDPFAPLPLAGWLLEINASAHCNKICSPRPGPTR